MLNLKCLSIVAATGVLVYGTCAANNNAFNQSIYIEFNGTEEPTIESSGSDAEVKSENGFVTITPQSAGIEVVLSGSSSFGGVKVGGDYPVKFVLNGLDLCSTNSAVVRSTSTNICYVVLPEGITNTLTDSLENSNKAILMSKGNMEISGVGTLKLAGVSAKHAICSTEGGVTIRDGEIIVENAGNDAVHAETDFQMDNGTLSIQKPGGDGVDCDGSITVNGGAISYDNATTNTVGLKCAGNIEFNGGLLSMSIPTAQTKGVKCVDLTVNGGAMLFDLSGAVTLEKEWKLVTNATTGNITTNGVYYSPSYCGAIKCSGNALVNNGKITINHSGMAGKGISTDGNFTMNDGVLDIYTSGKASSTFKNSSGVVDVASANCLKADGDLQIFGGKVTAIATGSGGDAITCSGEMTLGMEDDNLDNPAITAITRGAKVTVSGSGEGGNYDNPKAIKSVGNMNIYSGRYTVTTQYDGGEGFESKANLTIYGGLFDIETYDDCINAGKSLVIKGGKIYCYSSNNDAIDSNGTMEISGGLIVASGTNTPEAGLDCDQRTFKITGGIIVATGGDTSTPTASQCSQRSVIYTGSGTANTVFLIKDASGNILFVYKNPRTYGNGGGGGRMFVTTGVNAGPGGPGGGGGGGGPGGGGSGSGMTMLISSPQFSSGVTYSIVTGGTITGGTEFHGYYTGATVSGGTTAATFKTSSMVTKVTGK